MVYPWVGVHPSSVMNHSFQKSFPLNSPGLFECLFVKAGSNNADAMLTNAQSVFLSNKNE